MLSFIKVLTLFSSLYLYFVALTSRIRVYSGNEESVKMLRELRPAVYTFWYHQIFFLLYYFGTRKFSILMTPTGKTDHFTTLASTMGLKVAKGSLEGGGRHALLSLLESLKASQPVAVPASGPLSPIGKCKTGSFILAQEAKCRIIPVSWNALFKFKIPRRHAASIQIPLPFNSIKVLLGNPIEINRHDQLSDLDSAKQALTNQLNQLSPG